ncbi:hypothetical protein PAAG_05278 [Paracoccidioides lutzii Pb01]|uniref:Uncharacterized protein n=1 Tax=Paracoccidioides lutzii (strain ATCC MYA-826 / Pb01) TaxID=502779 RepID=C1H3D5_PARBA|nr:hypothetical protein PAAG_05278 [Paracoccidioides lutzii Pb01]EEH34229.2 hypothetical protein PAAG_05278 [Paracoccidioides lutzii Pb01]
MARWVAAAAGQIFGVRGNINEPANQEGKLGWRRGWGGKGSRVSFKALISRPPARAGCRRFVRVRPPRAKAVGHLMWMEGGCDANLEDA